MPIWKFTSAEGSGEQIALEDARLNLSAYFQAMEDIRTWLHAHDGLELEDLAAQLAAWYEDMDDLVGLSLDSMYQSMEDWATSLEAAGTGGDDIGTWLHAAVQAFADLKGWLEAVKEIREDLVTRLEAAKDSLHDLAAYLSVTDGTILCDLGLIFETIDGTVFNDFGTWLCAIKQVPAFRSVVAQRLASVTEVALGIVVDESGNPVTTITGETVTIS